jgi:hypothetical protein
MTDDRRQITDGRWQMTDVRGQITDVRGQITDNRLLMLTEGDHFRFKNQKCEV